MGYMQHHGLLVTSWNDEVIENARLHAEQSAGEYGGPVSVSPLSPAGVNGHRSFAVFPDGSKRGWDAADAADKFRLAFATWLHEQRFEDDSSVLSWVWVQYGDDSGATAVVDDSDHYYRQRYGLRYRG